MDPMYIWGSESIKILMHKEDFIILKALPKLGLKMFTSVVGNAMESLMQVSWQSTPYLH